MPWSAEHGLCGVVRQRGGYPGAEGGQGGCQRHPRDSITACCMCLGIVWVSLVTSSVVGILYVLLLGQGT